MAATEEQETSTVGTRVPAEAESELHKIAMERSDPGGIVRVSELVREALEETYGIDADLSSAKE